MKQLLYVFMFTVIVGQSVVAMEGYKPTGQGAWGGASFNPQAQRGANPAGVEQQRRPSVLEGQAALNAQQGGRRDSSQSASVDQLRALADRRLSASDSSMDSPAKY